MEKCLFGVSLELLAAICTIHIHFHCSSQRDGVLVCLIHAGSWPNLNILLFLVAGTVLLVTFLLLRTGSGLSYISHFLTENLICIGS